MLSDKTRQATPIDGIASRPSTGHSGLGGVAGPAFVMRFSSSTSNKIADLNIELSGCCSSGNCKDGETAPDGD